MRDTELHARLRQLGMPDAHARRATVLLRDRIHPVAALAVVKANDHLEGLSLASQVGMGGLDEYGYYVDGTSGLLKKIGKGIKKVAKTTLKVAKKVALPVAAAVTGGAALTVAAAVLPALKGAKSAKLDPSMRSSKKTGAVPYQAMTGDQLATEQARLNAEIARGKDVKQNQKNLANANVLMQNLQLAASLPPVTTDPVAPTLSSDIVRKKRVKVPKDIAKASDVLAKDLVDSGASGSQADMTAALMNQMLSQQGGGSMSSPAAQGVLQDVAAEGVQPTTAGVSLGGLPGWVLPAAAVAMGLVIIMPKKGRR